MVLNYYTGKPTEPFRDSAIKSWTQCTLRKDWQVKKSFVCLNCK